MNVKQAITSAVATAAVVGGVYVGIAPNEPSDVVDTNELSFKRELNMQVFDKGGQKRMALITIEPLFWDDEGTLKKIDTTVRKRPLLVAVFSKYEFEAHLGNVKVLFDKKNVHDYAVLKDGFSVEYKLLSDTTDVDILTETVTTGVKQYYTMQSSKATSEFRWLITTDADIELREKELYFLDGEGNVVVKVPEPLAIAVNGPIIPAVALYGDTLVYVINTSGMEYPITLDPTTYVTATAAQSESVWDIDGTYLTARNETNASNPGTGCYVGQNTGYTIYRAFFTLDTSGLPDDCTVDSARVFWRPFQDHSTDDFNAYLVGGTHSGARAADWFNDFEGWQASGAYTSTLLSDAWNSSTYAADSAWVYLNAAGIATISKTDTTRFVYISNEDINASQPANSEYVGGFSACQGIRIFYTEVSAWRGTIIGVDGPGKVVGVAKTSIAKVLGVE